ncbi:CBS domain-containing protein [Lelliottia amnigena]|uniref:Nucleotidyltransferase family protein n=1 Tax=Lelliottia amnigena TaxID=61646 RepID=A0AAP2AIG6_LELAM|nr:nucleotidyltransferase family protein [Lelliottia amnigena]MBL5900979.1 nucleotidyltransferase family protein [Lelliottia amnigena]MBL5936561.1 nucleotidyltransferase family protein [Lelliottia amnigena]NTX71369.1 CBS domain-containing protein [Lelliottia amnigena]
MTQKWENLLIKPTCSILEALEVINKEAMRIALIVDNNNQLLGVVTDGDIRRGLLNGMPLNIDVKNVMNDNPIIASPETSKKELNNLMSKFGVLSIPLVNKAGVVGLETISSVSKTSCHDNPVFIMAGGFGTRLKPLTDKCPKPMLKVGDKPILETLLIQFAKAGFKNIYISTHYMPEQISDYFKDGKEWGVNITYVHEETPLGTGGALGLLPQNIPQLPLIMINGDVLTTVDFTRLLDFHNKHMPTATMCVREYDYQIPYGVINGDGHRIISMQEKPVQRFFVNAGIYVISPELFKHVPKHQRNDMPTLLEEEIAKQKDVIMFPIHEYWLDIGRMDDFNRAQIDIKAL